MDDLRPAKRPIALRTLIEGLSDARIVGDPETIVTGIELDSRQVRPGDLFAALPGHRVHGSAFADAAIERGATAVLTDSDGRAALGSQTMVPVIVIDRPRTVLGTLAGRVFGSPGDALRLIGVTGTNGKTTVTHLIASGLDAADRAAGLIGTVGLRMGGEVMSSARTTPEAVHLQALLGCMRERGIEDVVMEVSSHAVCEERVTGMHFAAMAFTNLSQDHLDYHGSMEAYFAAKARLFTPEFTALGVIGVDDPWGRRLIEQATVPVTTWATDREQAADWHLVDGRVIGPGGAEIELEVPMPGEFNRKNALCAYVMLRSLGVSPAEAASGIARTRVPGRMERIGGGPVIGIVDYAHTPDAIERAVAATREATSGRLIVVLGAGGDRDREKRPLMGAAAARLADLVIITDDNPRSEDPASIRSAVCTGAAGGPAEVEEIPDRRAAIGAAVRRARPGDVVLVLGKGHEQGQEIDGVMYPFDDREVLCVALAEPPGARR